MVIAGVCERLFLRYRKHHGSVTRAIGSARTLSDCSTLCEREADRYCRTFSFRRSRLQDNCILSAVDAADLDASRGHLLSDPEWHLYDNVRGGGEDCRGGYFPTGSKKMRFCPHVGG